ncbi:DUF6210 family protein [Lentzea sp. NPDC055074]
MSSTRWVDLDMDTNDDWLYVVVEMKTGVRYRLQYGGTACRQGEVQGYLVPLASPDELSALRDLFENVYGGAGKWGHDWPEADLARLREIVEAVRDRTAGAAGAEHVRLRLDESRMHSADEAWIPVITADGPGVLLWPNSD